MNSHSPDGLARQAEREEMHRRFSRGGLFRLRMRRVLRGFTWLVLLRGVLIFKRLFDLVVGVFLLLLTAPLFLVFALLLRINGQVLDRSARVGRWCLTFDLYRFASRPGLLGRLLSKTGLIHMPVLWNLLQGDISLVGPRLVSPGEMSPRERAVRKRFNVRPGLISLWWIRQRANIDYESELDSDAEYVDSHSVGGDLGILARSLPALLYGKGVVTAPDLLTILDIPIHNLTMAEAIDLMVGWLDESTTRQVCFVNADCANRAYRDADYRRILSRADLCLADGIGLKMAAKLLGTDIRQNVNGTDLFPRLCAALEGTSHGIFLLGGRPGIAEDVGKWIGKHNPDTRLAGVQHGFFPAEETDKVIEQIRDSRASLLLVAFGAPAQDKWIHAHAHKTGVRVSLGVGGLFDFYSGRIPRAPLWLREMGLEWIYRFYQEPGRMWKRYLVGNVLFLSRVFAQKVTARRLPGEALQ